MDKIKVLIAIDEPEMAKIIVHTACNIFNRKNSEITLINVLETSIAEEEYFTRLPEKFIEHEAEKSDFAYIENFLENSGFDYKGFIYREGNAADVIINTANNEKYDLIVVGSHNKHAPERFFLGSVSYKVSRQSKCSVLVVKPIELSKIKDNQDYSVLFATDSSEYSEFAAQNSVKFLDKKRANISVLNVTVPLQEIIPADAYIYSDISRILEESELVAKEIIKNTAINLARQGLNVVKKYYVSGDAPRTIIDEAQKSNSNLIIMGSHGKTGFADRLLGSVSSRVYEYSPVSVMIIKK